MDGAFVGNLQKALALIARQISELARQKFQNSADEE